MNSKTLMWFQFQNGSIKSDKLEKGEYESIGFQFQNGSIKSFYSIIRS